MSWEAKPSQPAGARHAAAAVVMWSVQPAVDTTWCSLPASWPGRPCPASSLTACQHPHTHTWRPRGRGHGGSRERSTSSCSRRGHEEGQEPGGCGGWLAVVTTAIAAPSHACDRPNSSRRLPLTCRPRTRAAQRSPGSSKGAQGGGRAAQAGPRHRRTPRAAATARPHPPPRPWRGRWGRGWGWRWLGAGGG